MIDYLIKNIEVKEKIVVGTLVGVVMLGFIIALLWDTFQRSKLEEEGIYSIGIITNVVNDHHSSPSVLYEFEYMNGRYKGALSIERIDESLIGQRFFVILLPNNPDISKMLIGKSVPLVLKDVPYYGWKSIPKQ